MERGRAIYFAPILNTFGGMSLPAVAFLTSSDSKTVLTRVLVTRWNSNASNEFFDFSTREGAALYLFLIFRRVEIKINGLKSDQCR